MMTGSTWSRALLACHGFEVTGKDGAIGEVETPIFPPGSDLPDFLVVRVDHHGRLFPAFAVVPTGLVETVDPVRRSVGLDLRIADVDRLPSRLPVADAVLDGPRR
jgi:hypothetical protein